MNTLKEKLKQSLAHYEEILCGLDHCMDDNPDDKSSYYGLRLEWKCQYPVYHNLCEIMSIDIPDWVVSRRDEINETIDEITIGYSMTLHN